MYIKSEHVAGKIGKIDGLNNGVPTSRVKIDIKLDEALLTPYYKERATVGKCLYNSSLEK